MASVKKDSYTAGYSPIPRFHPNVDLRLTFGDKKNTRFGNLDLVLLQTRMFEDIAKGRLIEHIPRITPRISQSEGVAHHLCAVQAVEAAWNVEIPQLASRLRSVALHAKNVGSHLSALLSGGIPDLIGNLSPNGKAHVLNLLKTDRELATDILQIMEFGESLSTAILGKSIGPVSAIPGGLRNTLSEDARDGHLGRIGEMLEKMNHLIEFIKEKTAAMRDVVGAIRWENPISLTITTKESGESAYKRVLSGNALLIRYSNGNSNVADFREYDNLIERSAQSASYLRPVFIKELGPEKGLYLTGPLAIGDLEMVSESAANAAKELADFAGELGGNVRNFPLLSHWASAIDALNSLEFIGKNLRDPSITGDDIKSDIEPGAGRGISSIESPRGVIIYDLSADNRGLCTDIKIISPIHENLPALSMLLKPIAKDLVEGDLLKKMGYNVKGSEKIAVISNILASAVRSF